jgi:hypothetical protein
LGQQQQQQATTTAATEEQRSGVHVASPTLVTVTTGRNQSIQQPQTTCHHSVTVAAQLRRPQSSHGNRCHSAPTLWLWFFVAWPITDADDTTTDCRPLSTPANRLTHQLPIVITRSLPAKTLVCCCDRGRRGRHGADDTLTCQLLRPTTMHASKQQLTSATTRPTPQLLLAIKPTTTRCLLLWPTMTSRRPSNTPTTTRHHKMTPTLSNNSNQLQKL